MEIVAVIVVMFIGAGFVLSRRKSVSNGAGNPGVNGRSAPAKTRRAAVSPRNPWRGTSIVHDDTACDAVKNISGKRFLDTDRVTPAIPLPGCDAAQCNCRYERHEDRRDTADDRRAPNALQSNLYADSGKANRRLRKRGRRKTDWT